MLALERRPWQVEGRLKYRKNLVIGENIGLTARGVIRHELGDSGGLSEQGLLSARILISEREGRLDLPAPKAGADGFP